MPKKINKKGGGFIMQLSFFQEPDTKFSSVKFMTEEKKNKVYRDFKKLVDNKSIDFLTKTLYEHLHLHCGFIAHYNIHGFKEFYRSPKDFKGFLEWLSSPQFVCISTFGNGDYYDVNKAMHDYLKPIYPSIVEYLKVLGNQ